MCARIHERTFEMKLERARARVCVCVCVCTDSFFFFSSSSSHALYVQSLMVLSGVLMMWVYLYAVRTAPLVINGTPIDGTSKLVTCSAITMLVVFFLTDVGGLLLWAFTFGCIIIAVHGALRVPDDLFVDESEMNSGFFSMPMATAV